MDDYRQEALKELARRELASRNQPKLGLLERTANNIEQNINKPVEKFGRAARNAGAGFAQGIANTPANIYNLGAMGANALGAHLPQSPTFNFAPEDINSKAGEVASIFAAPELAFGAVGKGLGAAGNAIKSIGNPKNIFTTKNTIKNSLLNKHDLLEQKAANAFNQVSKEVKNRGINEHTSINKISEEPFFNHESIEALREYFPKTRAASKLLQEAKSGSYDALRKLQTDLYTNAKKNLSSSNEADRMRGAEMFEKRNDILEAISSHLKNSGNHDLDALLNEARHDWGTLQKTYYNENMNNALIKMFDKNFRKVPKNLTNILAEESIPMKQLLEFHPGLQEKLYGHMLGKNIFGKVKRYGLPAGAGVLGYEYGKH